METTPLVSVVMATYNEPKRYITESITSILNQTYSNLELLILDDSTNKDTIETINSFSTDQRVKIIRQEKRMGFVKALNEGLKVAKGKYIARMDGDDIALPERITKQVDVLENDRVIDVIGGNVYIIDGNSNVISTRCYPQKGLKLILWTIIRSPIAHPTVMLRRGIVDDGFLYDESFSKSEDIELWLRLRKNGYILQNCTDFILKFRVEGDLAKKRVGDNFIYNLRARRKNISWRFLFCDLLSLFIVRCYNFFPRIISRLYTLENTKKSKR